MTKRPLLWVEIRCDKAESGDCLEGGSHGWANRASDLDDHVSDAVRKGWKIINGQTVCPACAALK